MPHRDRVLALLSLVAFALCVALFAATQAQHASEFAAWEPLPPFAYFPYELAFAIGAVTTLWLACANARGTVTPCAVAIGVAGLLVTMVGFSGWLWGPLHDLTVAADLHPYVHDPVWFGRAPLIVFGPLIALLAWRGWRVARR